jgi:hypothetical protein
VTAPPGATYSRAVADHPAAGRRDDGVLGAACPGSIASIRARLFCEVQPRSSRRPHRFRAPTAGTVYHLHVMLDGSQPPGSSQIFNNHIPLDPQSAARRDLQDDAAAQRDPRAAGSLRDHGEQRAGLPARRT